MLDFIPRWAFLVAPMALGLVACGPELPQREWSAEDHAQAPGAVTDPQRSRPTSPPQATSPELARARAAAALFRVSCARCHGVEGTGDGPEAPAAMPDMNDAAWQASRTDEEIANVIRIGRPPMPAFGDQIQPEGIAALVEHIRRLPAGSR